MQDKDELLIPTLSVRRNCMLTYTWAVLWPSEEHMDRYFCYVSGADFPWGTLNKQTYLASREGMARACQHRFGAHLLLAKMNQGYSQSWLPQVWFWPVYIWASHWEWGLSEQAEWCGSADKAPFFPSLVVTFSSKQMTHVGTPPYGLNSVPSFLKWNEWKTSGLSYSSFQPVYTYSKLFKLPARQQHGPIQYNNQSKCGLGLFMVYTYPQYLQLFGTDVVNPVPRDISTFECLRRNLSEVNFFRLIWIYLWRSHQGEACTRDAV